MTEAKGIAPEESWCGRLGGINAGIGGHDTRKGLARFKSDVLSRRPDKVFIMFGLNDAYLYDSNGDGITPRIPLDEYRANLTTMIKQLKRKGASVVLMTPNATTRLEQNRVMRAYVDTVRKLAKRHRLKLVDLYSFFAQELIEGYGPDVFTDGVHPTALGNELIYQEIRK